MLGLGATVLSASTVVLWTAVADRLIPGSADEIAWGRRVLMPNMALHLGAAFALSQLASALLLLPLIPALARLVERLDPLDRAVTLARIGDGVGAAARELDTALVTAQRALGPMSELALDGRRESGRAAEHALADAHAGAGGSAVGHDPRPCANPSGGRVSAGSRSRASRSSARWRRCAARPST